MSQRTRKFYKLSDLSEEEVIRLMDSVETPANSDEEDAADYDSDDSVADPDFDPHVHEISPEDDALLNEHIEQVGNDTNLIQDAINLSLNLSLGDALPSVSTTLYPVHNASHEETVEAEPQPSSSSAVTAHKPKSVRPAKRLRSPLPWMEVTGPTVNPSGGGFTAESVESIQKDSNEFTKIVWKKKEMQLHVNDVAFQGDASLPPAIKDIETPMEMFCYFFTQEITQLIAEETNRCALSKDIASQFKVESIDVYKYIGILLYMSLYRYPNLESYWSDNAFMPIAKTMSVKRFMAIKQHLSFEDEANRKRKGEDGYDGLFRIRKVADALNERFDSVPKADRLCVDEQMCSTKMRHHLRQYMSNKPHKWGIKLFVLCDSAGYAYRFEIYNGAGDNVVLGGQPDLGSTANVVVRLSQTIPDYKHHILYFDNFYTSLPLLVYLRARGIYSLGTVRVNRIPNCKLPIDAAIKQEERGHAVEFIGTAYGVDVSTVLWKDNKSVRLASTYVGIKPFNRLNPDRQQAKATRYDRKKKLFIEVDCPQMIREYNSHMGGVDLMDGLMGRYHIRAKTRNAMVRLFYHFIDMAVVNAYILYRRSYAEKRNDSSCSLIGTKFLQLPQFREQIAAGLVSRVQKRGAGRPPPRPSAPTSPALSSTPPPCDLKPGEKAKHLVADLRFDGLHHNPLMLSNKEKRDCKQCKKSKTQFFCEKYRMHLCITPLKNCFGAYFEICSRMYNRDYQV